ncbi:phosphoglucosamine mutase [Mycobacterium frederiksbergense]|uniref:Phosphoglucosamine mutase n=2 Tax=Mycolicibacterium frederiksbergense TaxID=117567 RepID=A0ABT6L283_9MYCO|nr:phosphoglucosamine mutase [Mycolicibacterium frederiksbergense]
MRAVSESVPRSVLTGYSRRVSRSGIDSAAGWSLTSSVVFRAVNYEKFDGMGRLFGTDGVRGVANRDLTAELAVALGSAAARRLGNSTGHARRIAVVGRDPRASSEMLEAAVIAGITSEGVDALRVGALPTPAVAYLTSAYDADFGVMISASHNPMPDNGIKIFGPGGHKLDDDTEDRIEELVNSGPGQRPTGAGIGRVLDAEDALDRYLRHAGKAVTTRLDGLTVVVDCANGAAWAAAPRAYRAAGANVIAISAEPNGLNINDGCGSTHMEVLQAAVVQHGADLGLAHDGDADRCLAVDAAGRVIDGDAIMVVLALAMQEADELASNTLVTTVMSNLGLHLAMRAAGIEVRTTSVGDRYVLEELRAGEFSLGGEQSGHIVLPGLGTTGDGIVTGLRLMSRMAQSGATLAALAEPMRTLPQVLINVKVADKATVAEAPSVQSAVAQAEAELGDTGRILLRPSGTEQVVRVMVEAADENTARQLAVRVAESVSGQSAPSV